MSEQEAIKVLEHVKAHVGRRYKSKIRAAWMNGDYSAEGIGAWSSLLQNIRNQFGPRWLANYR